MEMYISYARGYPSAFDGKRYYRLTFDSIKTRSKIEPLLEKHIKKLPKGYHIVKTLGPEYVGKITKS